MANRQNLYRRQTKAFQQNLYKNKYGNVSIADQQKTKYLSIAGIMVPGVITLASIFIAHGKYLPIAAGIWLVCVIIVFISIKKKEKKFVRNLKDAGMPRKEFSRIMRQRTNNESQHRRIMKTWDNLK